MYQRPWRHGQVSDRGKDVVVDIVVPHIRKRIQVMG